MSLDHSAIITETCRKLSADITIIVHSDDENLTRVIHELCSSAVKRAVGPLDPADPQFIDERPH